MAFHYSRREFEEDLNVAEAFLTTVVSVGERVRREVRSGMQRSGIQGEIIYVGSTNPDRLTAVIDPKSPDERYPCDFDVGIVCNRDVEHEEKARILEQVLPGGETREFFGRLERHQYINKFPVNVAIFGAQEAGQEGPIVYSRQFKLSPDQIKDTRRLRLFMMRNGLYGGFTRGFKGITLEQAASVGDFEFILNNFSTEQGLDQEIVNPIDGKDLVASIHPDIKRRTKVQSTTYSQRGLIRAVPYTIEGWQEDHSEEFTFGLVSRGEDPYQLYKKIDKFIRKTLEKMGLDKNYSHLVIPHYGSNEALLAIPDMNGSEKVEFQERFRRRWDSAQLSK